MSQADLINLAVNVASIVLIAISAGYWGVLLKSWRQSRVILQPRFENLNVRVPRAAIAMLFVYIGATVYSAYRILVEAGPMAGPPTEADLVFMMKDDLKMKVVVMPLLYASLLFGARSVTQLHHLGLHLNGVWGQIKDGVKGFVASALPVVVLLLASSAFRSEEKVHPLLKLLQDAGLGEITILIFLSAAIVAPLLEELLFRVILQNSLAEFLPAGVAIGISSILFALVHGFPDAIPLLAFAVILGTVYHYRRSYLTVVLIHMLFNIFNLVVTLLSTDQA
ncbi:CPBP family intramembrane glutamic endopeptidase [Planctomicrobium sp. SH527]|uniref:CPBP family intramembrane glutamic endopeptidase n=1 Tax=Planctomicrobium sp. SH527 TaxID=3448123 RepID=UPI003F5B96F7